MDVIWITARDANLATTSLDLSLVGVDAFSGLTGPTLQNQHHPVDRNGRLHQQPRLMTARG